MVGAGDTSTREYTLFFKYKNKLYKNTKAKIGLKIKNKLRTITGLKFRSDKFKKLHRLRCT